MNKIYVVAATGGLEEPDYYSSFVKDDARNKYHDWSKNCVHEVGDRVDFMEIDLTDGIIRICETVTYED